MSGMCLRECPRPLFRESKFWKTLALTFLGLLVVALVAAKTAQLDGRARLAIASASALAEKARADAAELKIKNLTTLMKVSINARQLTKPIRISGEMIVSFAGEVLE